MDAQTMLPKKNKKVWWTKICAHTGTDSTSINRFYHMQTDSISWAAPQHACSNALKWWCKQKFGFDHIHAPTLKSTQSFSVTQRPHAGWLWLSCNRWRGYCPPPACAPRLWQQTRASRHRGRPRAPDANLTSSHNTQPGAQAVNPVVVAQSTA